MCNTRVLIQVYLACGHHTQTQSAEQIMYDVFINCSNYVAFTMSDEQRLLVRAMRTSQPVHL